MKSQIPIIEINRENLSELLPLLRESINNAYFIALDCEMSGLGDRSMLRSKSVEDRYLAMCQAATSRSILSIGISCFSRAVPMNIDSASVKFRAISFNILTLCSQNFTIEPRSAEFLVKHGFDFNVQFCKGISYQPGADLKSKSSKSKEPKHQTEENSGHNLRQLFIDLILASKPIVLHNSLVDLIFLYYHLYGPLPDTLNCFLADLNEMFPAGLYDTKYIADYCVRMSASYLEYIFRKCQRENSRSENPSQVHLSIRFPKISTELSAAVQYSQCSKWSEKIYNEAVAKTLCQNFCAHGNCNDESCQSMHDVDLLILDEEVKLERKRIKARKRKQTKDKEDSSEDESKKPKSLTTTTDSDGSASKAEINLKKVSKKQQRNLDHLTSQLLAMLTSRREELVREQNEKLIKKSTNSKSERKLNEIGAHDFPQELTGKVGLSKSESMHKCAHRAGFDAFMTGYSLAYLALKHYRLNNATVAQSVKFEIATLKNNIALSGKDFPLKIQQSGFVKTSVYHDVKFQTICNKLL